MDNQGIWNSFEAKDRCLDTVQYALHAGGLGFDSPHLHHLNKHRIAPGSSPGALHLTSHYLAHLFLQFLSNNFLKKFINDSMDSTIKNLLHLETFQGRIINKQIPRGKLVPLEKYYWPILNSINLPRKEMQKQVENYLFTTGHFDEYPSDFTILGQRRTEQPGGLHRGDLPL